ncbi:hypothetical protein [Helicobacter zhangjianzhongii]|uniref:Uncharacterized protein n=1 Tax=Helicobacter zhangjianzhongii TaxID=2974574 RepID=A0ACC6FRI7_9HELI|nr:MULTISPECIES: hypothetical protein [unclassified Helicobacter]MDL0079937.1 hypothetical protein [Helicobacter sp. CPD2-1]MDL0081725.1 hypothetical protein [Helicobacter sp. XJK30-2]
MLRKIALVAILCNALSALESNIIEIMQYLQRDSDLIQKGFFLNKFDIVKEGISKHKEDFSALQKFNIEVFLDEKTLNYSPIITSFLNNIIENRVALEKFLRDNDKVRAYEAFQELNHNCMKCHALLRGW